MFSAYRDMCFSEVGDGVVEPSLEVIARVVVRKSDGFHRADGKIEAYQRLP